MNKKISITLFLLITIFLFTLITFNASSYATVGNFIENEKNMIQNTATNAGNMIKNGTNALSNTVDNFASSMMNNNNNSNNNRNNSNYTATRTSVNTNDITVAGLNVNMWTLIIIISTLIGVGTLLWSYFMQKNKEHSDYYSE